MVDLMVDQALSDRFAEACVVHAIGVGEDAIRPLASIGLGPLGRQPCLGLIGPEAIPNA